LRQRLLAEVRRMRRRLLAALVLSGLLAPAAQARYQPEPDARSRRSGNLAKRVVAFAERQIGVPYSWGGTSRRTGFDCSGLVYAAYRSIGKKIPHSTWGQMSSGTRVSYGQVRPGDLLFTNGGDHVVLVVSKQAAVSAPHSGARVSYVSLPSLRGAFAGARRLLR
jgi:cell wall-associated NlpC family hydrolase